MQINPQGICIFYNVKSELNFEVWNRTSAMKMLHSWEAMQKEIGAECLICFWKAIFTAQHTECFL